MTAEWTFRSRTWHGPGYLVLEGSASFRSETADFFLVVGARHISLDVHSLRGLADRFLDLLRTVLGKPETGPTVVNIGELMDSLDEAPLNATWSFSADRRDDVLGKLGWLLGGGRVDPTRCAGEPER